MTTDSSKACLELIRLLSLPRDSGSTTFVESGNMKNLSSVADRRCKHAGRPNTNRRRGRRTESKILLPRLFQIQIINPSVGRIVPRLPVELLEKLGADDGQLTFVQRKRAAHGERERKNEGKERRMARGRHCGWSVDDCSLTGS